MIYLSGSTNRELEPQLIERGIGVMAQPGNSYGKWVHRYPFWAADNGCFSNRWVEDKWLRWLDRLPRDGCLFSVAPDVYPDAAATLERSLGYSELIRDMGFPVALVAQDGCEQLDIPWSEFDCLFIGGKRTAESINEWKTSPAAEWLIGEARRHGLWSHVARANSLRRLEWARAAGAHSCDGTFLKYGPRVNLPRMRRWLVWLEQNEPLPFKRFETPSLPVHREAQWKAGNHA